MHRLSTLIFLLLLPLFASAQTVSLTLAEVDAALTGDGTDNAPLEPALLAELTAAYEAAGLQWRQGRLIWSRTQVDEPLESGCAYSATLDRLELTLALASSSRLTAEFTSLREPMVVTLSAPVELEGEGEADQSFGLSAFDHCRRYARDAFDFSLRGSGKLKMRLVVSPGIELTGRILTVAPIFAVTASWEDVDYDVTVDHSAADSKLESRLRDEVDALFSNEAVAELAARLEQSLRQRLVDAWDGPTLRLELTQASEADLAELRGLLSTELATPEGEQYLRDHLGRFWYALVTRNRKVAGEVLAGAALCEMTAQQSLPVAAAPLYRQEDGLCRSIEPETITTPGRYFADADCKREIAVAPLTRQHYCRNNFDPVRVGDGALLPNEPAWALSLGARADIALVSSRGAPQPWMTAVPYRRVETDGGECVLEMRIYKSRIDATELDPLIALHGGNWQFRTRGMLGIEAVVPQFTKRDFVVFAPFYRLAGDREGPVACHNASAEEILDDVTAALAWVRRHGGEYGAASQRVAVTGQSAGAYLAAWLAVHHPEEVSRALLLYPPTDVADYLQQWRGGALGGDDEGVAALEAFLQTDDPANVDLSQPLVRDNSLPPIVAREPARFPPMFIIHGGADRKVPLRQSVRLCNALSGDPDKGPASDAEMLTVTTAFACDDRGSRLHLIAGAGHALDICFSALWCPAGDETARQQARAALTEGYDWLARRTVAVAADSDMRDGSGGGGALSWLMLAGMAPLWRQRRDGWTRQSSAIVPKSVTTPSSNTSQRTSKPARIAACTTLPR